MFVLFPCLDTLLTQPRSVRREDIEMATSHSSFERKEGGEKEGKGKWGGQWQQRSVLIKEPPMLGLVYRKIKVREWRVAVPSAPEQVERVYRPMHCAAR